MSEEKKKQYQEKEEDLIKLIRILSKDIKGNLTTYRGLAQIKGISWSYSNAICKKLKLDKNKKIQDLTQEEIKKIEEFVNSSNEIYSFLKNRRKDRDSGEDKHLNGADLDLQKDLDLKRMKKVKSYKGIRHAAGQPVRGQRTKSNFRKNKMKSGMSKKGGKK